MIERIATHLLLRPEEVPPSQSDWEVLGTFNPGAVRQGTDTVILVRVAERPCEQRAGWTALPRWTAAEGPRIDWVRNEELEIVDPRVVRRKRDGLVRLTFVSHLRVATSGDGRRIDHVSGPIFQPQGPLEEFGVEDPRITRIDDRYYITYVAVSRHGAATALASTADFRTFERHGVIFCPENKDVVLFPERVSGEYIALHRPVGGTPFARPEIWIARSGDLLHWGNHEYLFGGQAVWETGRVGAGTPPVALPEGWLEVYHGNRRPQTRGDVGAYCGGAILLAKENPERILQIGQDAVLMPQLDFEVEGFVAKVVFPTGMLEEEDRLLIYYGASDKYSAVAEISRPALFQALSPVSQNQ